MGPGAEPIFTDTVELDLANVGNRASRAAAAAGRVALANTRRRISVRELREKEVANHNGSILKSSSAVSPRAEIPSGAAERIASRTGSYPQTVDVEMGAQMFPVDMARSLSPRLRVARTRRIRR